MRRFAHLVLPAVAVATAGFFVSSTKATAPSTHSPYAVGLRVLQLVDRSRTIRLPDGRTEPRPVVTYVRYPAVGSARNRDEKDARPLGSGPFPLVVFGHGFALTPAPYAQLLRAWASAGYVVAAPRFPLENADAPGGPDERDLINQPADFSFVISRLLAASASRHSVLSGLVDPDRIAVAGHSDGADSALAVAYDSHYHDRRIKAAVIMSGALIAGLTGYRLGTPGPALLATQGTADTVNPPDLTRSFYAAAARPKFLLTLPNARHLAPYTWQQPQLGIVERTTTAFLDHYLEHAPLKNILVDGNVSPYAQLDAAP